MGDEEGSYRIIEDRSPQPPGRRPEPLVRSAAAFDQKYSGLPGGSVVKKLPVVREMEETWARSLSQKDPLRSWHPSLAFLPGEFHGQRSLVGHSLCGRRGRHG